jgi:4-hydroxy-tetrahydrodipicolinate synthase
MVTQKSLFDNPSSQSPFAGLGVALITPFREDGSVDYEALTGLVDWHLRSRIDFFCILGTTAETPCLSHEEKKCIKEHIVKQVKGRVPILMGCGGNCTASVLEEIRTTDWTGIDGILTVCPMYNKPTQEGLYQHYRAIAKESPVPVVLYNVPGRTGVNLLAETTLRLAREFKNIIAIKEASGNLKQIREIIEQKPDGFGVISGDDSLTLQIMQMGGMGVISVVANVLPAQIAEMVHLYQERRLAEATIINDRLFQFYPLMFIE